MQNWKVTDKYGQTCVVLAHNAEQAIESALRMYSMRGITAISIGY